MAGRTKKNLYKEWIYGVFGEFGSGANAKIKYIQSSITPTDLDKITLVSDIKGSERWGIRDLFQREVDNKRVTDGLLPYFESSNMVKFFNPLTLTVLPVIRSENRIHSEMPLLNKKIIQVDEEEWVCYEYESFFRILHHIDDKTYGKIEWNPENIEVVAIDGQHRLSALKRFRDDSVGKEQIYEDFMNWSIPIVIFGLTKVNEEESCGSILDIIRNIFIYINKTAKQPNLARQIILSDESINAICTQELLQYSHSNDIKEIDERNNNLLPLWFFDWRGEEIGGKRIISPGSIKSTEEIYFWFENYLLGDDFSPDQERALEIMTLNPLHKIYINKEIDQRQTEEIRVLCKDKIIEGLVFLLENFIPYKEYIDSVRLIEDKYQGDSDITRHAFYKLRFGDHSGSDQIRDEVEDAFNDLLKQMNTKKESLPKLIILDIGMRGIIAAFGMLKYEYEKIIHDRVEWLEYSKWFTSQLNKVNDEKWFTYEKAKINKLRVHITEDHQDSICNYKYKDAKNAFGKLIALLIMKYGLSEVSDPQEDLDQFWVEIKSTFLDELSSEILKGYKKQVRGELKIKFPLGGTPLTEATNKEAKKRVTDHISKIESYLESLIDA